jgi:hypothetical protein
MVWSKAVPKKAAKFLDKFAADGLKARLATINIGSKADS